MCGISGVYQPGQQQLALKPILTEMGSRLSHRGPDDQGIWVDSRNQIGFCHRRLSIVDLSSHGHQPMHSASQRYCIAYNGEIYNHVSLRVQLDKAGYSFKGHSDTEVLLAAIECWGLKNTLQKISGMFAFALWDKQEEKLCLVRDRMGEKPLYYGWLKGAFVFASELSALKSHPNWNAQIRRQSISDLLRYNYIPAPQSIYDGIYKLLPGHSVDIHPDQRCEPKPWWSLLECDSSPLKGDVSDSVELLDQTMQQVISEMQVADVPLGAFLSGGVDSSTVVSVMQAVSGSPVKTFTIGYDNADYDESAQARAIAKHLGTEHHEWIVTAKDALAVIPNLPNIYSEPFADASQVPTCLVSQLAKQHVTVALSGDGGDELFGGYNRHLWAPKFDHKMQLIPLLLRRLAASSLQLFSPRQWDSAFAILRQKTRQPGEKLHKIARILTAGNQQQLYELLVSAWQAPVPVIGQAQWQDDGLYQPVWGQDLSYAEKMMLLDSLTYLPD
ncbi:MAG: asparagine synthase (glutamine-hydrolyzing), partial [Methylococcales bacterium]|nr:asparagine synthase (glutamine-hydrolyzing) [Methylococcales bacterium]